MARLEELERKFEENPRRYFAPLANEYRKAGDAQRAAELCRSQLPEVPGHISGHIVLGQALYDARDFDGSRAALETALALDPENIVALRYLGDIARDTGDAVEAERWYSRTLEADPYNEAATTALEALRAAPPSGVSSSGEAQAMPAEAAPPTEEAPRVADEPRQSPDEAPQATQNVAVESTEPQAAADPVAEGFEPTAHMDLGPVEPSFHPPVAEAEPPVEVPEPGPIEAVSHALTDGEPDVIGTGTALAMVAADTVATVPEAPASGVLTVTGEFAGDLSISTAPESAEPPADEAATGPETAQAAVDELSVAAEIAEPAVDQLTAVPDAIEPAMDELAAAPETIEPAPEIPAAVGIGAEEPADEAAHAPDQPATLEEAMQAEERVLESAAPFVTETMADLYLEQGYPHEALELLLQLSEQRPHDEELRAKIEHIEAVIVARRDAAVAAARAERVEIAEAEHAAEPAPPPEAPFDAAVAEVDSSAFTASEPEPEAPMSVRELFARMDRARPRAASSVTPRPISRRRSDFVPMPEAEASASDPSDDPFAFPSAPEPGPVPRTSGPQQTFNPSTADNDDFDAWLRGLRGP